MEALGRAFFMILFSPAIHVMYLLEPLAYSKAVRSSIALLDQSLDRSAHPIKLDRDDKGYRCKQLFFAAGYPHD